MQKLIIVFFALLLMPSYALFAEEKPPIVAQQCAIQNSYIAEYINLFEGGEFAGTYLGAGGNIMHGAWFESKVMRGEKPCEFIYMYRVRNTSDQPLMVFWDTPSIVPQLVYLPIGGAETFSFSWEGQPSVEYRRVRIFSRVGYKIPIAKIVTLPEAKDHLWEKGAGSDGSTIFVPAQWPR